MPEDITLYFEPDDVVVEARIVELTPALWQQAMEAAWWDDEDLDPRAAENSIDRHWSWFAPVDLAEVPLSCLRVAIVTGDGQIQGAMVISSDSVPSSLHPGQRCLFVDQICSAPRNRSRLRKDKEKWFKGVGTELLQWGVRLSVELGCDGKLWLLASPEGEAVYRWLGFRELNLESVTHEGIKYKPMELPLEAVAAFFSK
ncbi:MAG: GNAT family N-acetyltransferase [Phycisphaerales bacterium]|nr:GNAT family N-acetyltransferase [Phycisphaerales bacterium]